MRCLCFTRLVTLILLVCATCGSYCTASQTTPTPKVADGTTIVPSDDSLKIENGVLHVSLGSLPRVRMMYQNRERPDLAKLQWCVDKDQKLLRLGQTSDSSDVLHLATSWPKPSDKGEPQYQDGLTEVMLVPLKPTSGGVEVSLWRNQSGTRTNLASLTVVIDAPAASIPKELAVPGAAFHIGVPNAITAATTAGPMSAIG